VQTTPSLISLPFDLCVPLTLGYAPNGQSGTSFAGGT
jgi:hypothetical protein